MDDRRAVSLDRAKQNRRDQPILRYFAGFVIHGGGADYHR
jgi:hypothetical protein